MQELMDPATAMTTEKLEARGVLVHSWSAEASWQIDLVGGHGNFLRDMVHRTMGECREPHTNEQLDDVLEQC